MVMCLLTDVCLHVYAVVGYEVVRAHGYALGVFSVNDCVYIYIYIYMVVVFGRHGCKHVLYLGSCNTCFGMHFGTSLSLR